MSSEGQVVRAGGGIVWRRDEHGSIELVLVHRPRYDDWTFPKGKLERGETLEECALREVEEETGLRCTLGRGLGTVSYHDSHGRPKIVHYWAMEPSGGALTTSHEVDEARWVALDAVPAALSYDRDRHVLARFSVQPATPVFLVRHARARNRRRWAEDDRLRPLSKAGRRQAEALVGRLDGQPLARIVSSPYTRCMQTLQPLARAREQALETADELAEGADANAALDLARSLAAAGPAALCTHGDVMQLVVQGLAAAGVPLADGGLLDLAKGSIWILDVTAGAVTGARYVPPPS